MSSTGQDKRQPEAYLSRFPSKLRQILSDDSKHKRFLDKVCFEYADIDVYRGIHRADCVKDDDFLGNLEEAELYGRRVRKETLEMCAVSVNEDKQQLITALHIPNKERPTLGIAKGVMRMQYGPADFVQGKTHHNWYLYVDQISNAAREFKLVDLT
ncbi:MAG: hypothetical protein NC548_28110 [Lachnospiraceae bacterium]|nr:hypothetical protein [Lachnospiraceae bacterium]